MQFVIGVFVGVIGYMLINDPSGLSDFFHQAGEWVTSYDIGESK
jgi:hypothetical protein